MSPATRVARRTVWLVWSAAAVLSLAVALTPLEVTRPVLRTAALAVALAGLPFAIGHLAARALWNTRRDRIRATIAATMALTAIVVPLSQSLAVHQALTPWQTTHVLYRHRDRERLMIALQVKDLGGFGYVRRVERTYELAPFLRWDGATLRAGRGVTGLVRHPGPEWGHSNEHRNPFGWR